MQESTTGSQGWHIAQWGLWGWIETILKIIGMAAGVWALLRTINVDYFITDTHIQPAAVVLMALLTVGMVFALIWRIIQREVISLIFAILNVIGHGSLLLALTRQPPQRVLPLIFCAFFVLGGLAKLRFLTATGYTEAGQSGRGMFAFSVAMVVVYVVLAVLLLV